jgi:hypothetical protein
MGRDLTGGAPIFLDVLNVLLFFLDIFPRQGR